MSSDDQPLIRVRTRRRALDVDGTPPTPVDNDPLNPGPMINYPPLPVGADGLPVPVALRQRIRDLRAISRPAARELILRTLHAFLIAHRPMDEIARAFGVSVRMIYVWRSELTKRMAAELRQKMPHDLLSQQIMSYERAKAYAWQQASTTTDHTDKRGWVLTAMKAEEKITDLYARAGLLKEGLLKGNADGDAPEEKSASALATIAREFLTGGYSAAKKKSEPLPSIEDDATGAIDEGDFLL